MIRKNKYLEKIILLDNPLNLMQASELIKDFSPKKPYSTLEIQEGAVKVRLRVIETAGFGDQLDKDKRLFNSFENNRNRYITTTNRNIH